MDALGLLIGFESSRFQGGFHIRFRFRIQNAVHLLIAITVSNRKRSIGWFLTKKNVARQNVSTRVRSLALLVLNALSLLLILTYVLPNSTNNPNHWFHTISARRKMGGAERDGSSGGSSGENGNETNGKGRVRWWIRTQKSDETGSNGFQRNCFAEL